MDQAKARLSARDDLNILHHICRDRSAAIGPSPSDLLRTKHPSYLSCRQWALLPEGNVNRHRGPPSAP